MSASKLLDPQLYRGQTITALSRWICLGLGLLALFVLRNSPSVRVRWALGVGIAYASYNLASQLLLRRRPDSRAPRVAHDLVDAVAVGLGAAFSGGLESPVWHLLYLHVVAVSVRGGLAYALAIGCLDATIVAVLARSTPGPGGSLDALTLLGCGLLGATIDSYLHEVQRRLTSANEQLAGQNQQLLATVEAHEAARRDEAAVGRLQAPEERYAAERLAAINEIANAVNLSLTIEDILSVAAEEACRLVPFDRLTIALLGQDDGDVEVLAVGAGTRRQRAPFRSEEVAWAFRRPMAWCHGGEGPPRHLVQGLLAEGGIQAVATLPLLSKDRVIGSMNLGRLKPVPFASADLAVMEPVARHIAIALDNARLLEAVRRRSREFESLLQIGRGIVERLELSELLPLVTSSVNRMMGTHLCGLLLPRRERPTTGGPEGLEPEAIKAFASLRLGEGLSGWVALHGKPLAVPDIRKDPRARFADLSEGLGYRSFLCVPLRRGAEGLGTLEV